jgi:hypothetical protein
MTPFDNFLHLLASSAAVFSIWWIIKLLFLLALLIYLAFAAIIIRQIDLMSKTLHTEFAIPIKLVAWIHLVVAILTFFLALIIL